jgi:DNA (cytosine-5)-methyltransferase 1
MPIPVIDLFAGPGGLGEGLSRSGVVKFRTVVSIEKDGMAAYTLALRAAHRALQRALVDCTETVSQAAWATWDQVVATEPWNIVSDRLRACGNPLIMDACVETSQEAWNFELGPEHRADASAGIRQRLVPFMQDGQLPNNIVLIGGPPCQAYSLVGRARNRGKEGYRPEEDHRHFLYKEYLHVIAEYRPAVFIMENVKGILTSTVEGAQIFESITSDLKHPGRICGINQELEYVLVSLSQGADGTNADPAPAASDFIVCTESLGIPQARHRVIICGIRRDVFESAGRKVGHLKAVPKTTVGNVIFDLPKLRSGLSRRGAGAHWLSSFDLPMTKMALAELRNAENPVRHHVADRMEQAIREMRSATDPGCGLDRILVEGWPAIKELHSWYQDRPLTLLANHESRTHMPEDLVRYLFVAAFGKVCNISPRLADFPISLLPKHKNIDPANISNVIFNDRFRVQLGGNQSTTVTSHISKDGHAFIHPEPSQCRSLSVREAARLQTFPDSYVFLGNRTSQYTQVGNAVPPMLACKIGEVVGDVLQRAGMVLGDIQRTHRPRQHANKTTF